MDIAAEEVSGDGGSGDSKDEKGGAFGCGSIDIKGGGPSGPTDSGGPASFLAMLALPFIMRRWRLKRFKESSV